MLSMTAAKFSVCFQLKLYGPVLVNLTLRDRNTYQKLGRNMEIENQII